MKNEKLKIEYAVVKIQGKQYRVRPGDEVAVDKLPGKEKEKVEFDEVLLLVKDGKVLLGQPRVEKAKVVTTVVSQFKGKKIRVAKYKAKARYRRVKGFRPQLTRLKIEEIS
jgi:large subunit ribosomal protein L21